MISSQTQKILGLDTMIGCALSGKPMGNQKSYEYPWLLYILKEQKTGFAFKELNLVLLQVQFDTGLHPQFLMIDFLFPY